MLPCLMDPSPSIKLKIFSKAFWKATIFCSSVEDWVRSMRRSRATVGQVSRLARGGLLRPTNRTIAYSITGIVQCGNQSGYPKGSGQDAFLGPFWAELRDSFEDFQGVATGIEVGGLEKVKEKGDVILPLA